MKNIIKICLAIFCLAAFCPSAFAQGSPGAKGYVTDLYLNNYYGIIYPVTLLHPGNQFTGIFNAFGGNVATTNYVQSYAAGAAQSASSAVTNGYPWGSLYDAAGAGTTAAQAATNGYPWGGLYDATGAAASVLTTATNAANLIGSLPQYPQVQIATNAPFTNAILVSLDGTNRVWSAATNLFDVTGAAAAVTNGLGGAAFQSTNFFDLAGVGVAAAQAATNGYPWGGLYDAAGAGTTAAHAVTNGYPWGTLYDATGAAASVLTTATNAANLIGSLPQYPQVQIATNAPFTNAVLISPDGTNRVWSAATNLFDVTGAAATAASSALTTASNSFYGIANPSNYQTMVQVSNTVQSATNNVLMNVSSNFVPYMGAISNVNLGNHSMSLSLITSGNGDEISGFKVSAQTLTNDLVDGFSYSANSLSSGGEQHGLFINSDSPITLDGFYGVYIDASQISINPDGYKYGVFVTGAGSHFGDIDTEGGFIGNETGITNADFIFGASQKDHTDFENQANRMFFDKTKAAFRAGHDLSGYWDSDKVGDYSWAGGVDSEASGWYSFAFGRDSYAWGNYSFAFGNGVNALGQGSIAMGLNASSDAPSFMAGTGVAGIGHGQIAMGYVSAYGKSIRAEGSGSIAMGQDVNALTNDNILVFGKGLSVSTANSFNVGFGTGITTPDFQVTPGTVTVNGTNTANYFVGNGGGLTNSAGNSFVDATAIQSATNNLLATATDSFYGIGNPSNYVTASVTNGLATTNYVETATNNVLVVATNAANLIGVLPQYPRVQIATNAPFTNAVLISPDGTNRVWSAATNLFDVTGAAAAAASNALVTATNAFYGIGNPTGFITNSQNNVNFGSTTVTNLTNSSLTANMIPYAGTGGKMLGSTKLQFDGTELGVGTAPVAGQVVTINTGIATNFTAAKITMTNSGWSGAGDSVLRLEGVQSSGPSSSDTLTLLYLYGRGGSGMGPVYGITMDLAGGIFVPIQLNVTNISSGSTSTLIQNNFSSANTAASGVGIGNSMTISNTVTSGTATGVSTVITNLGGGCGGSTLYGESVTEYMFGTGASCWNTAYGFNSSIITGTSETNTFLYNYYATQKLSNTTDTAYGFYFAPTAGATINDPVKKQVGYYINNNNAQGTDANMNRWAFYNATTNTTSGKVFLGSSNVMTFYGTSNEFNMGYTNGQFQMNGNVNINGTNTATAFVGDGGRLTNIFNTNTAPTSVTIGVTAPDFWENAYDKNGNLIGYTPVWTNH